LLLLFNRLSHELSMLSHREEIISETETFLKIKEKVN
jgi:hypothetical protein